MPEVRRMPPVAARAAFALLALLVAAGAAHAACESGLAERMHAKLYPRRALDERLAACVAWPAFPGRSIVALPLARESTERGARALDLALLVIQRPDNGNTERDTVIAHLLQPEALDEDGLRIQDLRIDTARYQLAKDARAFGLRLSYRGSARGAPYASETLRLYLPARNGRLRQVLDEVELERESGEWDLQCAGRFEHLRTLVTLAHAGAARSPDGFAQLQLARSRTLRRAQVQEDGECVERALPARYDTVTLHYDGERYRVPASLRAP